MPIETQPRFYVAGCIEVGLEGVAARFAPEVQTFSLRLEDMTASRAHLRSICRIDSFYQDAFTPGFVLDEALQLPKSPGVHLIVLFPFVPLYPLSDIRQVLQCDHGGFVLAGKLYNLLGNAVVDIGHEPSLPTGYALEDAPSPSGAFGLEGLSYPKIVHLSILDLAATEELDSLVCGGGNRKVVDPHVNTDDVCHGADISFRLDFFGDRDVKVVPRLFLYKASRAYLPRAIEILFLMLAMKEENLNTSIDSVERKDFPIADFEVAGEVEKDGGALEGSRFHPPVRLGGLVHGGNKAKGVDSHLGFEAELLPDLLVEVFLEGEGVKELPLEGKLGDMVAGSNISVECFGYSLMPVIEFERNGSGYFHHKYDIARN
jgi:hypothetical protein